MAKEKAQKEVKAPEVQAQEPASQQVAAVSLVSAPANVPQLGAQVFFHREVNTGNGVKLIPEVAFLVKKAAPESQLPEHSFDVAVLTNVYQVRFGIMHSPTPKGGYWSYVAAK